RAHIQRYNQDDCVSTLGLRDFLESRRPELEARLERKLGRPSTEPPADEESKRSEKSKAARACAARLLAGLPASAEQDSESERARRSMADLLEWHWREAKSGYWEFYRARELAPDDRLEDRSVLTDLRYDGVARTIKRSEVHRYTFPEQEHAVRA